MEPLKIVRSSTVVIASSNIDTDQIIPARFLTTTTKEGLGRQLFADWRYAPDGTPNPDFILNQEAARMPGAGRRAQFRLRLLARACALGAPRLWIPRRHQHRNRRHLPQQFAEERTAARSRSMQRPRPG